MDMDVLARSTHVCGCWGKMENGIEKPIVIVVMGVSRRDITHS